MTRERLQAALPYAALALVAAALTAWWIASARIPRGADQAVVALMARHILEGRGHPVFYWGSTYGGTLEPHLLAAAFALFGATPSVFRAFYVVLWAVYLCGLTGLTARFFGRRAGLIAAAYLAVPPFFLPYKILTSDGAYASVALLGVAVLWIAFEAESRLESGRPAGSLLALLGLAAGIGAWVSPVTLPLPALAFLWLLVRRGNRPSGASLLAAFAAMLLGAAPSIVWNLRHGFASVRARELAPAAGAGLAANLHGFFDASLPVFLGAARPQFSDAAAASFPGSYVVVPLVAAALLVPALRNLRDRRVRLLAASLALLAAGTILVARLAPREPRYLVAAYGALVPLLASGVAGARRGLPRALAAGGLAVLLASDLFGALFARRHLSDADDAQVSGPLDLLLAALGKIGATRVWSNYWTAYRVTFESGGSILATPLAREDGTRNLDWDAAVRAAGDPAVVLLPPRDACFREALVETREPFGEDDVGAFAIFHGLPAPVRDTIRSSGALPMPAAAYRESWDEASLPVRMASGGTGAAAIRVSNGGPCTWMSNVRLVATWSGPTRSEQAFATPDRRVPPTGSADLVFTLRAPRTAGEYVLKLDLDQEGIARFSTRGGTPFEAKVSVGP